MLGDAAASTPDEHDDDDDDEDEDDVDASSRDGVRTALVAASAFVRRRPRVAVAAQEASSDIVFLCPNPQQHAVNPN